MENRLCHENRTMGTDPFLVWHWLCPRHACPLQGEKKVPFSLSFPSSPHPQEAGWCHCIIWWQGMWWGKSLQLALGREKCVQSICTPALGECGQVQTTEINFLPVFIISSIIWCPYSVRLFMSVIFPALGKILVDQCVIRRVNWGLLPCTQWRAPCPLPGCVHKAVFYNIST